jgi:hypothetical protein
MTNGGAAAGGAAMAAAIAEATKASGAIVRVEPLDFMAILGRAENPLLVYCESRFFHTSYQYLIGYKGLVFYTKSRTPLDLPRNIEVVTAKKIWIPM